MKQAGNPIPSKYSVPIYSVTDILEAVKQYCESNYLASSEAVLDFVSELTGLSSDRIDSIINGYYEAT